MRKRVTFPGKTLPLLLLTPQLLVTLVFFIWPAGQALFQSLLVEDAFGLSYEFVWLDNFIDLFSNPQYLNSFGVTIAFAISVTLLSMGLGMILAVMADRVIKGSGIYRSILVWPYAVAPAVAGILWYFLFNPTVGILAYALRALGYDWNHYMNGTDGFILVVIAATWKQISYNFLFFLAGLQAIPKSLIEAAAIDGASSNRRFWTIIFPLLSPTAFFLLVVNVVYAFFDTFGVIHATTEGGPVSATSTLVYKVFADGFIGLDLGGSAAQSVILMIIVITLTLVQFKYVEKKVQY